MVENSVILIFFQYLDLFLMEMYFIYFFFVYGNCVKSNLFLFKIHFYSNHSPGFKINNNDSNNNNNTKINNNKNEK